MAYDYELYLKSGEIVRFQSARVDFELMPLLDANGKQETNSANQPLVNPSKLRYITAMAKDKGRSLIFVDADSVAAIVRDASKGGNGE